MKKNQILEIHARQDGWQRFERAVDAAVESGPKHRVASEGGKKRPAGADAPRQPRPRS